MALSMNPYLTFDGQAEAAMHFYAEHLGGKITEFHRFGGSPMAADVPPEYHERVMHAMLTLENGQVLMASDTTPNYPAAQKIEGVTLNLSVSSLAEAERVFNALAQQGTVVMPLEKTFWAERFGVVNDQFGVPWMVNLEAQPE
ncbi:VOC family protein [Massilia sp. W12]|uniref:VOC family protein n=1 Tax=Massilia sp. W12 TaxID=3126507 RepID=UPI0030CD730A